MMMMMMISANNLEVINMKMAFTSTKFNIRTLEQPCPTLSSVFVANIVTYKSVKIPTSITYLNNLIGTTYLQYSVTYEAPTGVASRVNGNYSIQIKYFCITVFATQVTRQ